MLFRSLHVVRAEGTRRLTGIGVLDRDGDLVRVVPAWENGDRAVGWDRLDALLAGRGHGAPC